MRKLGSFVGAAILWVAFALEAAAQSLQPIPVTSPWLMQGKLASPISVTTSSAATQLPTPGLFAWFCNTGSSDAYYSLGTANTVTTTKATGSWIKSGTCAEAPLAPGFAGPYTWIAIIGDGGTTTVYVETGLGNPPAGPNASGGGVLPAGAATSANQTSQITQETAINTVLGLQADAACSTDNGSCTLQALIKRNNQTLTTISTNTPALGQGVAAASVPVVLNSDPDLRPATSNITIQDTGSTTSSGQNSVTIIAGTPTAASIQTQSINGISTTRIQITGTWTGTGAIEGSVDAGTTWYAVPARVVGTLFTGSSFTANGLFDTDSSGLTNIRVRATAAVTGTMTVRFVSSATSGPVQVLNPVREVDNSSGAVATIKPASTAPLSTDTSKVVALNPNAPNAVTPAATEVHLGEVGGNLLPITNDMTTTNATITTGQSIGGLQTLANAVRVSGSLGASGTSGLIQSVMVSFKDAVATSQIDVFFFNANPTGSTCTNASAFILADADRDKVIGVAHITDFTAGNTAVVAQAMNQAMPFGLASTTSAFACAVARGSFAITGTANASLVTRVLRN